MSDKKVKELRQLILALDATEVETVKTYLASFHNMYGGYEPKTLQIFKTLLSRRNYSAETIKERCCKESSNNGFSMLLLRLKRKIYECLVLDINMTRADRFDNVGRAKVETKKLLVIGQVLNQRGLVRQALKLFDDCIKKATKYELYSDVIEALYLKSYIVGYRQGPKYLEELEEEKARFYVCQTAVENASTKYKAFISAQSKQIDGVATPTLLARELKKIEHDLETTESHTVFFFYCLLKAYENELKKNYAGNVTMFKTLFQRTRIAEPLKTSPTIAVTLLNQAYYEIHDRKFEDGVSTATRVLKYTAGGSQNFTLAKEYIFYAAFYMGDFDKAFTAIKQSLSASSNLPYPFLTARRTYLLACIYFIKSDHRKVHYTLNDTRDLDRDKTGWNIAVRVLLIMNQISQGSVHKSYDALIENLKEHVRAIKKFENVNQRVLDMLEVLRELEKYSFNFQQVWQQNQELLQRLSKSENYTRELFSHELIRFDQWFKSELEQESLIEVIKGDLLLEWSETHT